MQADRSEREGQAIDTAEERFVARGVAYRWRVAPVTDAAALRDGARREDLARAFHRVVRPSVERRKARVLELAVPAQDAGRARWVAWTAPGEEVPVWGLYRARRGEAPAANDAWELIAWGDGPALAWADEEPSARALLCRALREPPVWLSAGMASRDPTFAVRIEPVRRGTARGARRSG